jgi:hypothetical protein
MGENVPNHPQNVPNGQKYVDRLATTDIYQNLSLQGPPKFTQIDIFWFENIPSGYTEQVTATGHFESSFLPRVMRKKEYVYM